MGNCTSKKSAKALKLNLSKKPAYKMDKDQDTSSKGLSKKIAPFTKGEATSFGFKKKPTSSLPIPVTLTSNGNGTHAGEEKKIQNGILKNKELIDDYQSGSSVESLCHAPLRSTPKMVRKRDFVKQNINATLTGNTSSNNNNNNNNNSLNNSNSNSTNNSSRNCTNTNNINNNNNNNNNNNINSNSNNINKNNQVNTSNIINNNHQNSNASNNNINNSISQPNRFGFRQQTPPRPATADSIVKGVKYSTNGNATGSHAVSNQGPYDTGTFRVSKKAEVSARSRSEGPREAFFNQTLQPAGSMHSILNQPRASFTNPATGQPARFTLQTSHLPRPQFAVRMPDTKTAKTVTNYYRRGGAQSDSNSSKEGSLNEDSGFESHPSSNGTLRKEVEVLDTSPGCGVRRRLPAKGRKLEMKIVGNKFELLKKEEDTDPSVVTEVSLIKLPASGIRSSTAIINTGLVEHRTNQYLKRISQNQNSGLKDSNRVRPETRMCDTSSDSSHNDEGLGGESEEEKLFKDAKKSEKSYATGIMSCGNGETDDMLPGEAMAEEISLSLSSDEETSAEVVKKPSPRPTVDIQTEITPNSIRLDALKLSKQLKFKTQFADESNNLISIPLKIEDASFPLSPCDQDDEAFPSDSILEQLSSDSDSLGDKNENKNNDKEKDLKIIESLEVDIDLDVATENIEISIDEEKISSSNLKDIDIDIAELELDVDERELEEIQDIQDIPNNAREPQTPDSPGTPTNASNSLSLSDGRDFLIDDEIADQPELCFNETYPDCSCQEDVKTCNDKTLTSSGNNNDFVSCSAATNTMLIEGTDEVVSKKDDENVPEAEVDIIPNESTPEKTKRRSSVGTLSPCESLTSDDLMMDFESSTCDENGDRIDSANDNISVDDVDVSTNGDELLREWSSMSSQKGAYRFRIENRPRFRRRSFAFNTRSLAEFLLFSFDSSR